jgi:hypothetical protein
MIIKYFPIVLLLVGAHTFLTLAGAEPGVSATNRVNPVETGIALDYECDVVCLPPGSPVPAGKYAVVSPVGKPTVEMTTQAPRLESLDGKTIAVVGGRFMARVTHPEIKRLILENYPTAKVVLLNEIGAAGPYPGPGVRSEAKDEFQHRLKEMGIDAVISGNGGCGLCTPKETGSSIAAEYAGVPAVTVAAPTREPSLLDGRYTRSAGTPRSHVSRGFLGAHARGVEAKHPRGCLAANPQRLDPAHHRSRNHGAPQSRQRGTQGPGFRGHDRRSESFFYRTAVARRIAHTAWERSATSCLGRWRRMK